MINFVYYSRWKKSGVKSVGGGILVLPPMVAHHLSVYDLILLFIGTRMEVVGAHGIVAISIIIMCKS